MLTSLNKYWEWTFPGHIFYKWVGFCSLLKKKVLVKNSKNNIETALSKILQLPVRATILQYKLMMAFFLYCVTSFMGIV